MVELVSQTDNSPCMRISPFLVTILSHTANSPVPLTVYLGHACTFCVKQSLTEKSFKTTPYEKILFKSTPNGEICRLNDIKLLDTTMPTSNTLYLLLLSYMFYGRVPFIQKKYLLAFNFFLL